MGTKGQWRRECFVSDNEMAKNWARTFKRCGVCGGSKFVLKKGSDHRTCERCGTVWKEESK